MPRGASAKREREYEKLKTEFEQEGRYEGREAEVASRIVNKQRAQYGETKRAKRQEKRGTNPDEELPIPGYRHLTVAQIKPKLEKLSKRERQKIRRYEQEHKDRKTVLEALDEAA